jgi:uncharacterized protein (DUF433 family)
MSTVSYPYIEHLDDVPVIRGTRIKVRHIAAEHVHWLWEAPQIQRRHPDLSLAQIHSALAYYYDHKNEIDKALTRDDELADELQAACEQSPVRQKLRGLGLIS